MNKVTLITSHVWGSERRAGFHWIADAFLRQGWNVNFVTGYSKFDQVKGGYRKRFINYSKINTPINESQSLVSLINCPWWRPTGLRSNLLSRLTYNPFLRYKTESCEALKEMVASSSLVIMESTYEIMFAEHLRNLAPSARFVYRVSDDLAMRNTHPVGLDEEMKALPLFDLVSLPNKEMCERFPPLSNIREQKHGIPVHLYDQSLRNPYSTSGCNAIFTGNNILDETAILLLAERFADYQFHIIGPFEKNIKSENIIYYGEMKYEDTIPFVKHADIGLNTLTVPGFEESNKMQQYRYCGLPSVVNGTRHRQDFDRFYYKTGDQASLLAAFNGARNFSINIDLRHMVRSWDELAHDLIGHMNQTGARDA